MKKSESTRLMILEKAFQLIYKQGYMSTSVDEIIATTKLTKGAFYYHFKTKEEMGLAIIKEILIPFTLKNSVESINNAEDGLVGIYQMVEGLLLKDPFLELACGCPVGNFAQEMTPWNEKFAMALKSLTDIWKKSIQNSIEKGKIKGNIRNDVDAEQVSYFILSGYWGIRSFGKIENTKDAYVVYLKELKSYLMSKR